MGGSLITDEWMALSDWLVDGEVCLAEWLIGWPMSCWVAGWFYGWQVTDWVTYWVLSKELEGLRKTEIRKPTLFCASLTFREVLILYMKCKGLLWSVFIWRLMTMSNACKLFSVREGVQVPCATFYCIRLASQANLCCNQHHIQILFSQSIRFCKSAKN